MSSGLRDLGLSLGTSIAALAVGLGTQVLLARVLGTDGRGEYAVCMTFATLLTVLCMLGSEVGVPYAVASRKDTVSEGVLYLFLLSAAGSLVAIAIGLVALQIPLSYWQKSSRSSFYLVLLEIPVAHITLGLMGLPHALGHFGWRAVLVVSSAILRFVLMFAAVFLLGWGVNGAIGAGIVGWSLQIVLVLAFLRAKHGLTWARPRWHRLRDLFLFGVHYYVGKLSNVLNARVGTLILGMMPNVSRGAIGLFDTAAQLSTKTMILPNTLSLVLMPRVSSDKEGRPALVAQSSRLILLFSSVILFLIGLFAPTLIVLLFGREFQAAANLVRIIVIGVLVRSAAKVFVPYLLSRGRPLLASLAVALGMATTLGLLLLLLPRIGILGAAIAMAANYFISSAFLTLCFSRLSGISLFQLVRFRRSDWAFLTDLLRRIRRKGGPPPAPRQFAADADPESPSA